MCFWRCCATHFSALLRSSGFPSDANSVHLAIKEGQTPDLGNIISHDEESSPKVDESSQLSETSQLTGIFQDMRHFFQCVN